MTANRTAHKPPGFRGRFFTDFPARAAYSEGAGPYRVVPSAVAVPVDAEDLVRLVRHATEDNIALTARGAGSGMPGGNVGSGIVVDLSEFTKPLHVSAERIANVGAAITYAELNEAAKERSLRLPPDPSSGNFCTIGGMVATNAAGARSLGYGSVRQWVRGVEFISGTGERSWFGRRERERESRSPTDQQEVELSESAIALDFNSVVAPEIRAFGSVIRERSPKTSKNSAGYALDEYLVSGDIVDLIIGSEGTLGFISRVELDLGVIPHGESTLLATIPHLSVLEDVIDRLKRFKPVALEFMDRTLLQMAEPGSFPIETADAAIIAEFEHSSEEEAVETAKAAAASIADICPHVTTGVTPETRAAIWTMRRSTSSRLARLPETRRNLQVNEDGCVPWQKLGTYLQGVRESADRNGIEIVAFGHAGDGHVHVNALTDTTEPDFEKRLAALARETAELAIELGGTPSGEHGDGRLRTPYLERLYGREIIDLFRAIKHVFDPTGILNPGVIVPRDSASGLSDLKVGAGTTSIPPDIGKKLLDIEQSGGWAVPKYRLVDS